MNKYVIVVTIMLVFSETTVGMAQEQPKNESSSIDSKSIITSLINTNVSSVIGISSDDFWETFGPLINQTFESSRGSPVN
jgi:hypothetical protein